MIMIPGQVLGSHVPWIPCLPSQQNLNTDPDTSDHAKKDAVDRAVHVLTTACNDSPGNEGSNRFRQAGDRRQDEAFQATSGGVVHGQRNAKSLGKVVNCDGQCKREAHAGINQACNHTSQAFAEK